MIFFTISLINWFIEVNVIILIWLSHFFIGNFIMTDLIVYERVYVLILIRVLSNEIISWLLIILVDIRAQGRPNAGSLIGTNEFSTTFCYVADGRFCDGANFALHITHQT